jgi:hypothetical protein
LAWDRPGRAPLGSCGLRSRWLRAERAGQGLPRRPRGGERDHHGDRRGDAAAGHHQLVGADPPEPCLAPAQGGEDRSAFNAEVIVVLGVSHVSSSSGVPAFGDE